MQNDNPKNLHLDDTILTTWFERDRAQILLYEKDNDGECGDLIYGWYDDAVEQAATDGFLKGFGMIRDDKLLHASAFEYAKEHGFLNPDNRFDPSDYKTVFVLTHPDNGVLLSNFTLEPTWSYLASEEDINKGAVWFDSEEEAFEALDEYYDFEISEEVIANKALKGQMEAIPLTFHKDKLERKVTYENLIEANIAVSRSASFSM